MQEETKQCCGCRHFVRYYTKGIRHYLMAEAGLCIKMQCVVKPQESCDNFSLKSDCGKPSKGLLDKISGLFSQIKELSRLIEEEIEENG